MKNIFEVSLEERNRILGLHENATKKQYLKEQEEPKTTTNNLDSETEPIKFSIPLPSEFNLSNLSLDIIYDKEHDSLMVQIPSEGSIGEFYDVPTDDIEPETILSENQQWIVDLQEYLEQVTNETYYDKKIVLVPTYQKETGRLSWLVYTKEINQEPKFLKIVPTGKSIPSF